jgi:murein L,D-transpeptidase YcbB/YkuD
LRAQGGHPSFPVPGEAWHVELPAKDLKRLASKHGDLPVLRRGSKGPSVVKLKKRLWDAGIREFSGEHSSNRYDPFYGIWTERAVKRFQDSHGMKPDGVVGPSTWKAL